VDIALAGWGFAPELRSYTLEANSVDLMCGMLCGGEMKGKLPDVFLICSKDAHAPTQTLSPSLPFLRRDRKWIKTNEGNINTEMYRVNKEMKLLIGPPGRLALGVCRKTEIG
jgi:hypothetical protein